MGELERIDPETGEILPPGEEGRELTPPLSEEARKLLMEYQGAGYSEKPEDRLTPILSILQDLSGEVKRTHDRYLEGTEAGMMIIRSLRQLYPGKPGLLVQPFGFHHMLVEWTGDVGEGIPVARYPIDDPPDDMFESPDPQNPNRKIIRRRTTMNRLVDTREHYANVLNGGPHPFSIVIPMSGSNHASSRQWTNLMSHTIIEGIKASSFFRSYRVSTTFRRRGGNQSWFSYQIDPGSDIRNLALLRLGAECFESVRDRPIVDANLSDLGGDMDDQQSAVPPSGVDPTKVI